MGAGSVAPIQANILQLAAYKSQLEFSITQISNKRMNLAYQTSLLINADYESDPRIKQLEAMDNYLELQQKQLETQQKAAAAELESLEKMLDNSISKVFKLNISG